MSTPLENHYSNTTALSGYSRVKLSFRSTFYELSLMKIYGGVSHASWDIKGYRIKIYEDYSILSKLSTRDTFLTEIFEYQFQRS